MVEANVALPLLSESPSTIIFLNPISIAKRIALSQTLASATKASAASLTWYVQAPITKPLSLRPTTATIAELDALTKEASKFNLIILGNGGFQTIVFIDKDEKSDVQLIFN
ncbi:hypothetical protein EPI10_011175 [Gossypium australe]|uniref:Uncharacterized protein n=1 Tax=Gossypium australe TaxID=47621 RepID=A0A5B6W841_9ROSI|nr:hypothetical protein EPI10_011175 [Gossypium australe]